VAQTGDPPWLERVPPPVIDELAETRGSVARVARWSAEELAELVDGRNSGDRMERFDIPVTCGRRIGSTGRRVEDALVPALRIVEALILSQVLRNQEWHMDEQFPIVNGV
jgi:hypothetical protein